MALELHAGILDRVVQILGPTKVVNPIYGTRDTTWAPIADVRAEIQDVLPSRGSTLADGIEITSRPARVRMRWRADVTQSTRLKIDGLEYKVVAGPAEIGERRKSWMELLVERLSTEGNSP
jgi:head-tail adaptor